MVNGRQDDVEIGEEDEETVLPSEESVTPPSDILVSEICGVWIPRERLVSGRKR